jgi:hypothetical protein
MSDNRYSRTNRNQDETSRDRELGLFRPITRRDLLHGAGLAMVGSMTAPLAALSKEEAFAPERAADYYPPARTGLRGYTPGAEMGLLPMDVDPLAWKGKGELLKTFQDLHAFSDSLDLCKFSAFAEDAELYATEDRQLKLGFRQGPITRDSVKSRAPREGAISRCGGGAVLWIVLVGGGSRVRIGVGDVVTAGGRSG